MNSPCLEGLCLRGKDYLTIILIYIYFLCSVLYDTGLGDIY